MHKTSHTNWNAELSPQLLKLQKKQTYFDAETEHTITRGMYTHLQTLKPSFLL